MPKESFTEYNTLSNNSYLTQNSDLDTFLINAYKYYISKGVFCSFLTDFCFFIQTSFLSVFAIFLIFFVDFPSLYETQRLADAVSFDYSRNPLFFFILFLVLGLLHLFQFYSLVKNLKLNLAIRAFYTQQLGLNDAQLVKLEWNKVAILIGNSNLVQDILGKKIEPLDIAIRLMRKDNFLLALINKEIVSFEVDIPYIKTIKTGSSVLTELCIRYLIFDYVFKDQESLNPDIFKARSDPFVLKKLKHGLRRRFRLAGIMTVVLLPVICCLWIIYIFFRHGEEFLKTPSSLLKRKWSPVARWKLRDYNELPHLFEQRLLAAYEPILKFLQFYPRHIEETIAKCASFIIGALLSVLLVIIMFDKEFATDLVVFGNINAFIFAGFLGTLLAVCRGFINEPTFLDAKEAFKKIILITHYIPSSSTEDASYSQMVEELGDFLEPRLMGFIREITSMLFAPFLLFVTLPKRAEMIILFFCDFTSESDSSHVCSCSQFFSEKPMTKPDSPTRETPNETDSHSQSPMDKSKCSALYFGSQYPGSMSNDIFLRSMIFQDEEEDSLSKLLETELTKKICFKQNPV